MGFASVADAVKSNKWNLSLLKKKRLKEVHDQYGTGDKSRRVPSYKKATKHQLDTIRQNMLLDQQEAKRKKFLVLAVTIPITTLLVWAIQWAYVHWF